jgi:hypothetical protein
VALESSIAPRDFNFAKKQAADEKFAREEKEVQVLPHEG